MSTKLIEITSTRKQNGPTSVLDVTAFYGGDTDGPCLQLTVCGTKPYVEFTRDDVFKLRETLEDWLQTRFRAIATNADGHDI